MSFVKRFDDKVKDSHCKVFAVRGRGVFYYG